MNPSDYLIVPTTPVLPPVCIPYDQIHLLTTVQDANLFGLFCGAVGFCIGAMIVYGRMRG